MASSCTPCLQKLAITAGSVGLALIACSAVASTPLSPNMVPNMEMECNFTEHCLAGETFQSGDTCRDNQNNLSFSIQGKNSEAIVTHPNGSRTKGLALRYEQYGGLSYTIIATGNGSGTSTVTIFPDNSAIWTGHFTVSRNIASSHFGTCEVKE